MLLYLIKCSVSLAVLYVFYRIVLRPLTFYQWNRFYLLCYSLLSFFIPFININPWVDKQVAKDSTLINLIPSIGNYSLGNDATNSQPIVVSQPSLLQRLTITDWIILLFAVGAIIMLVRLLLQYASLRRIRKSAVLLNENEGVQLYETQTQVGPFSFGNAIYFNRQMHSEEELQRIVQHEFVHVKQKHTIDLMLGEFLCVINWFNPFAWFIRYSIRQNLEFIADNNVVANGLDKKEYQYLLLKVIGIRQYSIASNFNFSNLKKRIAMMNKMKSAKLHLAKFLFVLPLMAVLLLAFRNNNDRQITSTRKSVNDSAPIKFFSQEDLQKEIEVIGKFLKNNPGVQLFYTTEDKKKHIVFLKNGEIERYGYATTAAVTDMEKKYGKLPSTFVKPEFDHFYYDAQWRHISEEAEKIFQSGNANTKQIIFPGDSRVLVQLKNNNVEIYDMDYGRERMKFEKEYGKLPTIVPASSRNDNDTVPAPTAPPVSPVPVENETKEVPPVLLKDVPYNKKGYKITIADNNGECVVLVKDRAHKIVKAITLTEWNKNKKENETLYGALPAPPPPPPPPVITGVPLNTDASLYGPGAKLAAPGNMLVRLKKPYNVDTQPLYVIDGVVQPSELGISQLNPNDIESIDVLKDKPAEAMYAEKGKNGVVLITTKKSSSSTLPLYVIDGVIQTDSSILKKIDPNNIESIDILKDNNAAEKYGTRGKNGVIEIKIKAVKQPAKNKTVMIYADSIWYNNAHMAVRHGRMIVEGKQATFDGDMSFMNIHDKMPLVIYNGKEVDDVQSFNLVKATVKILSLNPNEGVVKYGSKAKFGALEINKL